MNPRPTLWILAGEKLESLPLGPMVRYREMAKAAVAAGYQVRLCLDGCTVELPEWIAYRKLEPSIFREIAPGDRILARISIPPRMFQLLLDSSHSFDVDFYSVSATEGMESRQGIPAWRVFQGSRRTALRYRIFLAHARRILFSIPEQQTFLGGMLFSRGDAGSCRLASRLPERCLLAPMGVSEQPIPDRLPNPYPSSIQGRPIFLWGGGIWAWFDIETLLQAFVRLQAWGSPAVLFFLCGSNPSGLSSQDAPVRNALARASELGLMGKSVHFLEKGATSDALPGYLFHCTAGIMANPARIEAVCSWRTRLLDLLWIGKPVITSGYDPLSSAMAAEGRGTMVPVGDVEAFAQAIRDFVPGPSPEGGLPSSLAWSKVFTEWLKTLNDPFPRRTGRPSRFFWFRYLLGI